ncbi:MAG: 4Fe-4S binding protein [Hydrogenophilaceae bacterium]|nr:4Fe-4S binding protein [Hydrogenophilaceae bacterium]
MDTAALDLSAVVFPELNAERCVHASLPHASCRACVDACPRYAWILGESALRFNEYACDECGLCVPVCPQQAIRLPMVFEQREVAGEAAMMAHCHFSGVEDKAGQIPCLHAIGLTEVLHAWSHGQRVWIIRRGDCGNCNRAKCVRLDSRVAALNSVLLAHGLPKVILRDLSAAAWSRLLSGPKVKASESRRRFLSVLGGCPVKTLARNGHDNAGKKPLAPGEYLPEKLDASLPWHVQIDPARCIACHACARVCPQNAIEQVEGDIPAYQLHHRLCTGCGLCRGVCSHDAVSLRIWEKPRTNQLVLRNHHCNWCGVSFQAPVGRGNISTCLICASASPKRNLRQVVS